MKKALLLMMVIALTAVMVTGCGGGVSEDKPIAEIKQEAQSMDAAQLQAIVDKYKKAIEAKKPEIQKLKDKLSKLPITELMGKDAAAIKDDLGEVTKSIQALTARMQAYVAELSKK